jgi:hypothetical protein
MTRLDIGEALGEGFSLVGRRPLDCVIWGIACFLLTGLPSLLLMGWLLPDYLSVMREVAAHPNIMSQGAAPAGPLALAMKVQALQPIIWLGVIAGQAVVYSAIFRAVLRPQERGFFHLELSSAELWVGLVLFVQYVCIWLTMVALAMLAALFWVPAIIAGANRSLAGWEIPVGLIGALAAAAMFFWLCVRFSMGAPLSFAERRFRLFESWRLTQGSGLGLFLLYLAVVLLMAVIAIVLELVLVLIAVSLFGLNLSGAGLQDFLQQPAGRIVAMAAPYLIGFDLVWAIVGGFFMAVIGGAWASAFRQLAPSAAKA